MTSSASSIDVDIINHFVSATGSVFRTMLGAEVNRGSLAVKEGSHPPHEVSGVIGLTGPTAGTMLISLSRESAIGVCEAMLGTRPESLDSDVVDAVGEVANMIAGNAKANMADSGMRLSLPNVVMGVNHSISFPSDTVTITIPFSTSLGPICIEIGLSNGE